MKKFIKNNLKLVIAFIIGIIISGGSVFAATIYYNGSNVGYDNTTSGLKDSSNNDVEDVQTAIDVLNTKMQYELFLEKYITKSGTPTNRAFGIPTTSDPETSPTGKNIYIGLYSDEQTGVCIKRQESGTTKEYCFRRNNWIGEANHIQKVLSNCSVNSSIVYCNSTDFSCSIYSNGRVNCSDKNSNEHCYLGGDGSIDCGTNQS